MESVTKRIHISGLTPNISYDDLKRRFSSFGQVKALDGLSTLDALGQPRRFAYITLEGTKGQITKCLNVLSGTTWKGAKLRVGEAKPDYKERIAKENAEMKRAAADDSDSPRKKRIRLARGCSGVHAPDMSLVTPANYATKSGWTKTPMGRLVRSVRMRPSHPLPQPTSSTSVPSTSTAGVKVKPKKKKVVLVTRARRTIIDPMRYGSEYLKGVLLEGDSSVILPDRPHISPGVPSLASEDENEMLNKAARDELLPSESEAEVSPTAAPEPRTPANKPKAIQQDDMDLAKEAAGSLALLSSFFGDAKDTEEWGGQETLSDVDVNDLPSTTQPSTGDQGFEVVPRVKESLPVSRKALADDTDSDEDIMEVNTELGGQQEHSLEGPPESSSQQSNVGKKAADVQTKTLKDMFKPREEDVGFSLLANLDIDLELDDTPDLISGPLPVAEAPQIHQLSQPILPAPIPQHHTFDTSLTLFFPHHPDAPLRGGKGKGRQKDVFDVMRERGLIGDGPHCGFVRTETAEEIRQRWEARKGDLTREWKRRHREAAKSARRRGGDVGNE